MPPTRCGYVSIVGKPNVGKSSLLNALAGKKLSIVSSKPGTTRHRVHAAVTRDNVQALFMDTPGLFKPKSQLDTFMEKMVTRAIEGVDVILFVTNDRGQGELDRRMLTTIKIRAGGPPVILVLNKMDKLKGKFVTQLVEKWRPKYEWKAIIPISAMTGKGLPLLWEVLAESLPEKAFEVENEEDIMLDEQLFVADLIREKALERLDQEVPHSMAVVVQRMEGEGGEAGTLKIAADLIVERDSQKAIVIGAGGTMVKAIGTAARKELEERTGGKVYLELFVKVKERWRDDPSRLAEYGYED